MLKEYPNADKSLAFIAYTSVTDQALEHARNALKNAGFENIVENTTEATISSHCGPNALGILYLTM